MKNLWHLPLTTNIERNRKAIENPGRVAGAEHDISFIGRLYERNSYDRVEGNLPDYLKGYLDSAILAQSGLYGANIIDRILTPDILAELGLYFELKKSEESFSSLGLIFETTTLGFKIAQVQRNRALTMLSQNYPHRVFLYTSVPTPDLMLVENMGLVDYWEEASHEGQSESHDSQYTYGYSLKSVGCYGFCRGLLNELSGGTGRVLYQWKGTYVVPEPGGDEGSRGFPSST